MICIINSCNFIKAIQIMFTDKQSIIYISSTTLSGDDGNDGCYKVLNLPFYKPCETDD